MVLKWMLVRKPFECMSPSSTPRGFLGPVGPTSQMVGSHAPQPRLGPSMLLRQDSIQQDMTSLPRYTTNARSTSRSE